MKCMHNEDNLKVPTSEEAREYGRRGGIQSAIARRKKKELKACLELLLESSVGKKDNGEEISGAEALATTVFRKALNGDLKAWELVRDTSGQKPVEKVITADVDSEVIDKVEALVEEYDTGAGD